MPADRTQSSLRPHPLRTAELVARQLRRRIVTGELADGDELPRENDLVETFAVSRPSLREALRILETEGLIRIRRGRFGGAVVQRPTAESAAYHLGLTMQSHEVALSDFAAARSAIQPTCAALAASRDTHEEIAAELTELVEESRGLVVVHDEFAICAQRFHSRLVELCGNTTMVLIAGTLEALWASQELQHVLDAIAVESAAEDAAHAAIARRTVADHARITGHIARGDRDGAARAMRRHLANTHDAMFRAWGDQMFEILEPAPDPAPGRRSA